MKNIVLIMPYGSVGGMERLAKNFYSHYTNLGYKVTCIKFIGLKSDIITFGDDERVLSTKDLGELSAISRLFFYLLAPIKIRKILLEVGADYSISFGDMANIFSALTYTNEYKIGSIHALKSVELSSNSIFNKVIRI